MTVAFAALAEAQTIQVSGGTIEENQQVSGRNRLVIAATGNPDGNVTVTVSAGTVDFEYIRLRPQRGAGQANGSILLLVRETGSGVISRISEITMLPTTRQAELLIGNVVISGSISTPSGALATVAAPVVGELDVFGDIVAQVTSGPRLFSSETDSTINLLRSRGGSILGSVTALNGPINTISAAGSIGSPAIPTTIRGAGLVQTVTARSLAQGSTIIAGSLTQNYVFGTSGTAPGGLAGQIIINPSNSAGNAWTGSVQPRGSSSALLTPIPNYSATTASLGGGSVGLVPYNLHDSSCNPPQLAVLPPTRIPPSNPPADTRIFLASNFSHSAAPNREITLEWYGPVYAAAGTPPVSIFRADENGNPAITDQAGAFSYTYQQGPAAPGTPFGAANRRITLFANPSVLAGRWVIMPRRNTSNVIVSPLCDGVSTTAEVPVANFRYDFYVAPDCDLDNIDDAFLIDQNPLLDMLSDNGSIQPDGVLDPCQCGVRTDYNRDGNSDQGDVDDLINAIAGSPNPTGYNLDFNRDGNTDQGDIDALTNTIAGAVCP